MQIIQKKCESSCKNFKSSYKKYKSSTQEMEAIHSTSTTLLYSYRKLFISNLKKP